MLTPCTPPTIPGGVKRNGVCFDGVEHCEFDKESPAKCSLIGGTGVECALDDCKDNEQLAIELLNRWRHTIAEKLTRWVITLEAPAC